MIDRALIDDLVAGRDLSPERMTAAMRTIMTGGATDAQIGGFLVALRMKGESVDEIAAAAAVMRELATGVPVDAALTEHLVDTCGTGGDGSGLFNVSTAAAFVVAAAGGFVAKHGNRSVSSQSGSADLLEAAGVRLDTTPAEVAACIRELGVGFMFAPAHHEAMKHAVGVRRELGVRTLFNIIGPLTNPAGAANQLMGVFNGHLCEPLAHVLHKLGSRHVMIVHGEDGLDELSINAPSRVAELKNGQVHTYKIAPEDVGLERGSLDGLRVDNAAESLTLVQRALSGEPSLAADIVAFNAGAALYVGGQAHDLAAGVALARETLNSGAAARRMAAVVEFSHARASTRTIPEVTHTILDRILARKREEIEAFRRETDDSALADAVASAPSVRGFAAALATKAPRAVIAEIKKASPSKGLIREDFDVAWLARRYAAGGAACLSVLTDRDYFQGRNDFLAVARNACELPVLRKDFMIDPIQIDQSRALGADCVLLIAAALPTDLMSELAERAFALGMDVLAEVHNETELERALALPTQTLLGINNRDLHTFDTTLDTSLALRRHVDPTRMLVSESGIHTSTDIARLAAANFGTFLVGESFMRAADPGQALAELIDG